MTANLHGDYSAFPHAILDTFPRVAGEVCELRQSWSVFQRLFMEDPKLTFNLSERFGPLLAILQDALQDSMLLLVAKLTDRDNRSQANLSVWCLQEAAPFATSPDFPEQVKDALDAISKAADSVRKHRHKRIAHFDRDVSLNLAQLPKVSLADIGALVEMLEKYLNLFFWEFQQTTMLFDMLPAHDITRVAEATAMKAKAYDALEDGGAIPRNDWRKYGLR
jgi:hypothetical protein